MPPREAPNITIRLATPDDAPAIADVLVESFLEFRPLYTDRGFDVTTPDAQGVLARLQEGPIWIGLMNTEVVATGAAKVTGEGCFVRGMAVLPRARGLGLGKMLLERIESFARQENQGRLYLGTTPFLEKAIGLYERRGFRRVEEGPHDLFGTPLFTMVKILETP